jgi:hypothetical protein
METIDVALHSGEPGPWGNPTEVFVDSITVSTGSAGPWEFGTSEAPFEFYAPESEVTGTLGWRGPS